MCTGNLPFFEQEHRDVLVQQSMMLVNRLIDVMKNCHAPNDESASIISFNAPVEVGGEKVTITLSLNAHLP